jgi:hypothetical protein
MLRVCICSHFGYILAVNETDRKVHVVLRYNRSQLGVSDLGLLRAGLTLNVSHVCRSDTRHATTYSETSESVQQCLPACTR